MFLAKADTPGLCARGGAPETAYFAKTAFFVFCDLDAGHSHETMSNLHGPNQPPIPISAFFMTNVKNDKYLFFRRFLIESHKYSQVFGRKN
jgi:hypothetical protein